MASLANFFVNCEFSLACVFAKCEIIRMQLAYTTSAIRDLKKLPQAQRARIVAKIEAYAAAPQNYPEVAQLRSRPECRLRVGDWRVLFTIASDVMTVTAVGHRRDIYD